MKSLISRALAKYDDLPVTAKAALWFTVAGIVHKSMSMITMPIFTRMLTTEQEDFTEPLAALARAVGSVWGARKLILEGRIPAEKRRPLSIGQRRPGRAVVILDLLDADGGDEADVRGHRLRRVRLVEFHALALVGGRPLAVGQVANRSVVHADADRPVLLLLHFLLDLVAGVRAGAGTDDRRRRVAASAAELVTDHAAENAADHASPVGRRRTKIVFSAAPAPILARIRCRPRGV